MSEKIGPWTLLNSTLAYENPWIRVDHQKVLNPNGNPGIYGKIHFKHVAIGIVAIDDEKNTWLVGQFRYPLNTYSWEIPEGGGRLHVDPLEEAKRELLEECGIEARRWERIQEMQLSNSVSDEIGVIFLATDLSVGANSPEDTEQLEIKKIPFIEALQMVLNGSITDSLSVAGILKAHYILQERDRDVTSI